MCKSTGQFVAERFSTATKNTSRGISEPASLWAVGRCAWVSHTGSAGGTDAGAQALTSRRSAAVVVAGVGTALHPDERLATEPEDQQGESR
jgi:hypothetical protein